jgi:hypothetical protein
MPSTKDASGYKRDNGEIQIAVRIPKPVFDQLQRIAVESDTSISGQMRDFITAAVQANRDKGE